jgi:hypothetical protein
MGRIRVAVVDSHPLFRAGVAHSLTGTGLFDVVGEVSTRDDALRVARDHELGILKPRRVHPRRWLGGAEPSQPDRARFWQGRSVR